MAFIETALDLRGSEFRSNRLAMEPLVTDLRARLVAAALGGGEASRARHVGRGKLLPRQRVETLLDPGTPFLEFSQLAAGGLYQDEAPAAGLITGIGRVAGRECLIRRTSGHALLRQFQPGLSEFEGASDFAW